MSDKLRELIPSLKNKYYFNYGGQGPLPKPSLNAIMRSWEIIQEIGPFTNDIWPFIFQEIIKTKTILSNSLGVNSKNIALTENVSEGIVLPLWGLKLKEGDELLISDCEHPGIVAASREFCIRHNLKFKILPIQKIKELSEETLLLALKKFSNSRTKVVIISHILWNFGFKIPLKEFYFSLKKISNNAYLLIDGAQSFGHIDIKNDVQFSDLYSITSHKWACGPEGLGAVYLSDRFIENSDPTIIGWKSLKKEQGIYESYENNFHADARKFEIATSCIPLLAGLRKSLELIESDSKDNNQIDSIIQLSNRLWTGLDQISATKMVLKKPLNNGIVSFDIESISNKDTFIKKLGEKKLWIRVLEDPKWFRACVHKMTSTSEIDLLINEIKKMT